MMRSWRSLLVVAALVFDPLSAMAATKLWNGSVSNLWSNPANWSLNGAPATGDHLVFPQYAPNRDMVNDLPAGTVFDGMKFEAPNYFVVSGNAFGTTKDIEGVPTILAHVTAHAALTLYGLYLGGIDVNGFNLSIPHYVRGGLSGTGDVYWAPGAYPGTHTFAGTFRCLGDMSGSWMGNAHVIGGPIMPGAVLGQLTSTADARANQGLVTSGNVSVAAGGALSLHIGGSTRGATYGSYRVNGSITIAPTGQLGIARANNFVPGMGQVFMVVENDGTDPVSGTFQGLPEGAVFNIGTVFPMKISYVGGDGNDITLTSMSGPAPAALTLTSSTNPARPGDCVTFTASVTPGSATGTVTFFANGVSVGTVAVSNGVAALNLRTLSDGAMVVAQYNGDSANAGAASNAVEQDIDAAAPRARALTDFNADGRSDILWHNASSGHLHRMLMDGFGIVQQATVYHEPNTAWSVIADADFNGDGVTDVLWRHAVTGQVYMMVMGANGAPSGGQVIYTEPRAAWQVIATPDLDGDRNADLVWWNSSTGQQYVMLMSGFVAKQQGFVYTEPNTQWRIVAFGDFHGTCRDQLVWRNQQTGQVYLQRITPQPNGTFTYQFDPNVYVEPDLQWKLIGAPDLDGDGKADLAFRSEATGVIVGVLMDGSNQRERAPIFQASNDWRVAAFGDYNGDGKSDLLLQNQLDGRVHMALMYGLGVASQGTIYYEPNLAWRIMGPPEYAP